MVRLPVQVTLPLLYPAPPPLRASSASGALLGCIIAGYVVLRRAARLQLGPMNDLILGVGSERACPGDIAAPRGPLRARAW